MKYISALSTWAILVLVTTQEALSFQSSPSFSTIQQVQRRKNFVKNHGFTLFAQLMSTDELKSELNVYLQKRKDANADELAKK